MDLWLPTAARPHYKCHVADCDATFTRDQKAAYQRHVVACARKNRSALEQEIGEHRENRPHKGTAFDGPVDPERASWLRRKFGRRR